MKGIAENWRKSEFSGTAGDCVEVAPVTLVAVRDSKDPEGATLYFTDSEWIAFLRGAAVGEFNVQPARFAVS